MALNPSIILSGQQFDLAGAMQNGLNMAASQKQFDTQNALAELYKTQGAGMVAGDPGAINALAQFDPQAALGIKSQHQQNAYATEDQQHQRETARREGERYAKEVGAERAAADAAELEAGVRQALAAPSPDIFDAMMTQMGRPEMVGRYEDREMLAIPFLSMAEGMKLAAGPEAPKPGDRYRNLGDSLVDLGAEGGPSVVELGGPPPKVDFSKVSDLRKEWIGMPAVKTFQTQSDSFGRIIASSTEPSGAGDVALVYSYMKMLDPGSVVREGEFATAENTAGVDQKIVGIYNRLLSGERLTPEMRTDFVDRAKGIYVNAEAEYDALRGQYTGIAERNGFPVEDALPDFRYSGERPGKKTEGGKTVVDGYTIEAVE